MSCGSRSRSCLLLPAVLPAATGITCSWRCLPLVWPCSVPAHGPSTLAFLAGSDLIWRMALGVENHRTNGGGPAATIGGLILNRSRGDTPAGYRHNQQQRKQSAKRG